MFALGRDQAGGVGTQPPRIISGNNLRRGCGNTGVNPCPQLRAILLWHSEQQADCLQGQITGEAFDEIERFVFGQRLDQGDRAAAQLRLKVVDGAIGEALVDKAAQPLVPRIIAPVKEFSSLGLIEQSGAASTAATTLVGGKSYRIEYDGHAQAPDNTTKPALFCASSQLLFATR